MTKRAFGRTLLARTAHDFKQTALRGLSSRPDLSIDLRLRRNRPSRAPGAAAEFLRAVVCTDGRPVTLRPFTRETCFAADGRLAPTQGSFVPRSYGLLWPQVASTARSSRCTASSTSA